MANPVGQEPDETPGKPEPSAADPAPTGLSVALFLAHQVVVSLAMVLFFLTLPSPGIEPGDVYSRLPPGSLLIPFCRWDGHHYCRLAEDGYAGSPTETVVFYPLYPVCIAAVKEVTGNTVVAGLLVVTLASIGFAIYLARYASHYLSTERTLWVVITVLCYPPAFFLAACYSEAMFLFLLFGFLYHYEITRSPWSLLFAILLPLARAQAYFLAAAFVVYLAWRWVLGQRPRAYDLLNVAAFALGVVGYHVIMWVTMGDPFAGVAAQNLYIFDNSLAHILNPVHFLTYLVSPSPQMFAFQHAWLDKVFIVGMLLGLIPVARTGRALNILFYLVLVYCPAAMGLGGGFPRYALIPFPLLAISCFQWEAAWQKRWSILVLVLVPFVFLQAIFIIRFTVRAWVA
jgi:hypothetical protein